MSSMVICALMRQKKGLWFIRIKWDTLPKIFCLFFPSPVILFFEAQSDYHVSVGHNIKEQALA